MAKRSPHESSESADDRKTDLPDHVARKLIDSSAAVHYVATISRKFRLVFISQRVRDHLGYDPSRFTADPDFWADHIHPDDRTGVIAGLSRIADAGRRKQEYRFRHSDGRYRWLYDESVVIRGDDRDALEIAGTWFDITERKESEASLARQKSFSDSLIKTAPTVVLLLGPDGRIMDINPYMEQLSGYSVGEVVGKDWFGTFLPEEDRPEIQDLFDAVMAAGVNTGHTNPIVVRDGTLRQIEWHAKILEDEEGERIGLLNIGHDVTDRIEYQKALEEARQQAEDANASKSRFLAAASHDLRQPLYALRLFLGALGDQPDSRQQAGICDKMHEAIDTMAELLDALLDISKLETGSVSPQAKDFPIQALLDRVIAANQPQAEEKGLQFNCVAADCVVRSDPMLLERVVNNLVGNAIRYTDRGEVRVTCRCSDSAARIDVTDTGIGIPEEDTERIFEEYYQLDNPGRDRRKGLGLGLAIVKRIALLLDHGIDVRSVPGDGSTFSVEVPLGRRHEAGKLEPLEQSETPTHQECGSLVLLIDDDPAIVDATTTLLELRGVNVISASNGDEALARVEQGMRPNVIISDYRLPGESGIDVIRRIRSTVGEDVPAALVTGDTELDDAQLEKLPACSVLYKPVDSVRLTELVDGLVSQPG